MPSDTDPILTKALETRYSDAPTLAVASSPLLNSMLSRGSCRRFTEQPVPLDIINLLCAAAFASPSKSDLQQRDIILLSDATKRKELSNLVPGQAWVGHAPMIAVFCGNNRRQRLMHTWKGIPFANDHLDAFFNAAADAAIALGAFLTAAEALGLGCCPISAVRNEAKAVSDLLGLPDHVFPFAGLAFGYPKHPPTLSKRLPLRVTCHVDAYREENLADEIASYDQAREALQPYARQRFIDVFGQKDAYGWSDDKVRQYSQEERADFGSYVRDIGFDLR